MSIDWWQWDGMASSAFVEATGIALEVFLIVGALEWLRRWRKRRLLAPFRRRLEADLASRLHTRFHLIESAIVGPLERFLQELGQYRDGVSFDHPDVSRFSERIDEIVGEFIDIDRQIIDAVEVVDPAFLMAVAQETPVLREALCELRSRISFAFFLSTKHKDKDDLYDDICAARDRFIAVAEENKWIGREEPAPALRAYRVRLGEIKVL